MDLVGIALVPVPVPGIVLVLMPIPGIALVPVPVPGIALVLVPVPGGQGSVFLAFELLAKDLCLAAKPPTAVSATHAFK